MSTAFCSPVHSPPALSPGERWMHFPASDWNLCPMHISQTCRSLSSSLYHHFRFLKFRAQPLNSRLFCHLDAQASTLPLEKQTPRQHIAAEPFSPTSFEADQFTTALHPLFVLYSRSLKSIIPLCLCLQKLSREVPGGVTAARKRLIQVQKIQLHLLQAIAG